MNRMNQINALRMAILEYKLEGILSNYTLSALVFTENKDIIALISDEKNFVSDGEKLMRDFMHQEYFSISRNQKGM
jgi:hypothetical protein